MAKGVRDAGDQKRLSEIAPTLYKLVVELKDVANKSFRSKTAASTPGSPKLRSHFGQVGSKTGPKFVEIGPMLPELGPKLADIDKCWPNSTQVWSKSTLNTHKLGPKYGHGQTWPTRARSWSSPAKAGRIGTNAGLSRTNIGRNRPNVVQCWSKLTEIWSELRPIWPNSAQSCSRGEGRPDNIAFSR